jgi:uncharacterized protein with von Willebrand factor type A (vWA) domain
MQSKLPELIKQGSDPFLTEGREFSKKSLVEFCRFGRTNGLSAGLSETIDALRAVALFAAADKATVKLALRSVLCSSPEDWTLFEDLFAAFWGQPDRRSPTRPQNPFRSLSGMAPPQQPQQSEALIGSHVEASAAREKQAGAVSFLGASAVERFRKVDFAEISQTDLAELEQLSMRLLRRMSYRVAKRLRAQTRRDDLDFRTTFRKSVCRGGELIDLRYKAPKREDAKLVVLVDVSDSMNAYSLFLLKFAYALGKCSKEIRSFVFSTLLVEVSAMLRTRRIEDALRMLAAMATGWAGGTRIGGSLREFNRRYASALATRQAIFIILSDGWDTGNPADLAAELKRIRRRVRRLIWLNPLLGLEDYQPATGGMRAALPYVDVFAPAHNLESLLRLEVYMRSPAKRR